MKTISLRACRSVVLLMLPALLVAQTAEQPLVNKIGTSGFVDLYYGINFNRPISRTNMLHVFDQRSDEIRLSLAELVVEQQPSPVGFRLDVGFGPTNDAVHYQDPSSTTNLLQQAYFSAVVPVGSGITVDIGKFVTHMGYELIESKDNWNYSRSFLFGYAIPFFHVGARASYQIVDGMKFTGYLYNGWDRGVTDNNSAKTLGATVNINATPSTGIILNWIGGPELADGSDELHVFDLIVTSTLSDQISVGMNADYGFSESSIGTSIWKGVALYGRVSLADNLFLAARGEYFMDLNGVRTGVPQDAKELTLTLEHKFAGALLTRIEFRRDVCTTPFFDDNHAQNTFVLGTIVSF